MNNEIASAPSLWEVSTTSALETAAGRERLLRHLRPVLEERLMRSAETREFAIESPLGHVHLRRRGAASDPGAGVRLVVVGAQLNHNGGPSAASGGTSVSDPNVNLQVLPDDTVAETAAQLVGLDDIHESVLHAFGCRWDGTLERWSADRGHSLPAPLHRLMGMGSVAIVFNGDPGTGKSVSPAVIGDKYCRRMGIDGYVVRVGAEVRGDGHVGNFGARVRAAFDTVEALPEGALRVLQFDEAEAIGMRRSELQSHQEDRAGTCALLQNLDRTAGLRRFATFLTTNLIDSLDAAILRRTTCFVFPRPDAHRRAQMLAAWLPALAEESLRVCVEASEGMTPADVERTLLAAYLAAINEDTALTEKSVYAALANAHRTRSV